MTEVVSEHPMKLSLKDVPVDDKLKPDTGWGEEGAAMG